MSKAKFDKEILKELFNKHDVNIWNQLSGDCDGKKNNLLVRSWNPQLPLFSTLAPFAGKTQGNESYESFKPIQKKD